MAGGSGLVLRRARSQRLVVAAAFGTILLATTVLSALTVYSSSVTDEGVDRVLAAAPFATTGTKVSAFIGADQFGGTDREVREAVGRAYGSDIDLAIYSSARSSAYARAAEVNAESPDLIGFGFYDGIEDHARLIGGGAWPRGSSDGGRIEAAIPAAAAEPLGVRLGSELELASRVTKQRVTVVITGLFEPLEPAAPFWNGDQLVLTGRQQLAFRTFGPLVVTRQAFLDSLHDDATALWLADPDLTESNDIDLASLGSRIEELPTALGADDPRNAISVSVRLPDTLAALQRARLVARSTMLIPVLELVVLAGYALLLTARLLAEHRRTEHALLRARGAATGQIAVLNVKEGLLLAAPAALVAPLLATPLLGLVGQTSSAARFDLAPLSASSWAVAGAAAALCAIALTMPSLRGSATYVESQQQRGRGRRRSTIQQAGADLALALIAVLAFLQLRHYGGPVVSVSGDGQAQTLGFDPLIAAGPALGLLAGGILALRLVPLLSRATESVTARRRSLAPALGAWQVSRRPLRYAGPALLLVMATSIGVLSVVTTATWRRSQQDQADFQVGTDLRVATENRDVALSPLGTGEWLGRLPGVDSVSPALRRDARVGDEPVQVVALNAGAAAGLLRMRSDLTGGRPVAEVLAPLAEPGPYTAAAPIPGTPAALAVRMRAEQFRTAVGRPYPARIQLTALIEDGRGVVHPVPAGEIPADGAGHEVTVPLSAATGSQGRLSHPLALIGFEFEYPVTVAGLRGFDAAIERIRTVGGSGPGEPVAIPDQTHWVGHVRGPLDSAAAIPGFQQPDAFLATSLPKVGRLDTEGVPANQPGLDARVRMLLVGDAVADNPFGGAAGMPDSPRLPAIPAVVTSDFPDPQIGRQTYLDITGERYPIRIAGVVQALPTTTGPAVLVDYRSLVEALYIGTEELDRPEEWWLAAADPGPAAAALAGQDDLVSTVQDRLAAGAELRADPLSGGLQGALLIGFGAALAFAAIGFTVNAAVSARERLTEFALLRALGVSSRQVFGLLGVEQAFLAVLGLAGGLVLGLVLAQLMVPLVVAASQATVVRPDVILVTNWAPLMVMLTTVVVVLATIVALLASGLRRRGLGATLRIGEDR
ncbi:MAG TPA: FtsX-like permease family protein [Actinomycetes bacterium]|nr:FtsX-like permease family protein [Actinomycetes bacterium]